MTHRSNAKAFKNDSVQAFINELQWHTDEHLKKHTSNADCYFCEKNLSFTFEDAVRAYQDDELLL